MNQGLDTLQPQRNIPTNNVTLDKLEMIAMRLGYPDEAPRDPTSLDMFIEAELTNRDHTYYV